MVGDEMVLLKRLNMFGDDERVFVRLSGLHDRVIISLNNMSVPIKAKRDGIINVRVARDHIV